ncbi:MAG: tetratricopeptide repeat protein, partial [Gammaproteobacteria bacterium]
AVLGMLSLAGFYTYELAAERDRAKAEATRANQTALFLRNLFRLSDPDESGGETITARMLLDQGVRQLDLTLGEQPQIRAQLQTTMGEVYASLGILEEAGKLLDTARGELEKTTPLPRAELVTTLNALSAVRMRLDKFEDAHKFAEQAIALANGTDDILPFASELEKANAFTMESRHEEAIALLQDMRSRLEQAAMTDTALYASTLTVMAENVEINGDYDSAVSALERAVDIYLRLGGRLNGETIHAQRTLAHLYDRKRDFPASKALYDQAYEAAFQLYGEVHPTMSLVLADMSTLHRHMGDNDTAFGYSERALAISREVFGSEHSHVAYDMVALANLGYLARGMSYAEPLYLEALDIYGRTVRAEHPYIAAALISYANRLETENRHEDARAALDRGRGVCIAALGAQHWLCGQFDTVFGIVLRKEGNEQAATSLLLNGFETGRVGRGVGHGATKRALQQLVENLDALGDPRAAEYRTLLEDTSSPNR